MEIQIILNLPTLEKKNRELDISIAKADNIINSVGPNHGSRNIIKNGKATISTYRLIGSLDTNVEVQLEDFILINTPGTLKLLSLPSFSGLSSLINNETGIEFAYGKISYIANEDMYSNINAYAVNDGIGLVLNGLIDRKKKVFRFERTNFTITFDKWFYPENTYFW
jgi:peptidoglycan hydrolase-like amidase